MSGNNPYSRHHGDSNSNYNSNSNRNTNTNGNGNTTDGNGNADGNGNDNNYHLRNPYSPHAKRAHPQQQQQQQQQQQKKIPSRYNNTNQGNSNDSRRPFNPYSQKTQQRQPIPNQYTNTRVRTSNSSFAISPVEPQEQQQHRDLIHAPVEQQQPGQGQSHQNNTNPANDHDNDNNSISISKNNNNNNNNNINSISHPAQPNFQQQQPKQLHQPPQDQKVLLDTLKDQLDQSNESNFELEASVMALDVELQHTKKTLTEQAHKERSKLEHELRLAQQETKRWKALAQQQQNRRSIVRDAASSSTTETPLAAVPLEASTSAGSFSSRLLGDSAGLQPSSPSSKKPNEKQVIGVDHEKGFPIDGGNHQNNAPKALSPNRNHFSIQQRHRQHKFSVAWLARILLEQLEPSSTSAAFTRNSQKAIPKKRQDPEAASEDIENSKSTAIPIFPPVPTQIHTDIEKGDIDDQKYCINDDDTSIRRVLLSIASSDNENLDATFVHHKQQEQSLHRPTMWTEGKLVEWLVRTFSSESSDRYWSALLLQSPEARKYVTENISLNTGSGQKEQQQQPSFSHQRPPGRRRRNRIRPLALEGDKKNDAVEFDKWQQQIRRSLRNPWWNPNEMASPTRIRTETYWDRTADGSSTIDTNEKLAMSQQPSSPLVFRKWATSLAASKNLRHLHTLRVLLAEAAGRKGATIPVDGDGREQSGAAWWALCYPSIATTIQRIVYRKLIRSKRSHITSSKANGNRSSNSNPRNASSATNNSNGSCRYRIGRFKDRLKELPEASRVGGKVPVVVSSTTTMAMEIDKDDITKPSAKGLEQQSRRTKGGFPKNLRGIHPSTTEGKTGFGFEEEEEEDKVLALALSVWMGLLQVASSEQLEAWYGDRTGLGKNNKKQQQQSRDSLPPCGGLFMVCLLLDFLEDLQFNKWMSEDDPDNPMSLSRLLSTGVLPSEKKAAHNGKHHPPDGPNDPSSQLQSSSSTAILPKWYDAAIAVLTQVGKTPDGMRILRSRVLDDPEKSDRMGNVLDVSIRQLHTLALHVDDVRTRHGSILRFGETSSNSSSNAAAANSDGGREGGGNNNNNNNNSEDYVYHRDNDLLWCGDPLAVSLLRSVEAWVRLWHQVLLFAQSTEGISFRSLVLALKDWFTSTYATLMASEEVRREIKAMIRWQLDELMMDEEDYEESRRRNLGQR